MPKLTNMILSVALVTAGTAGADPYFYHPDPMPEAFLVALKPTGTGAIHPGWVLSYQNTLTGPEVPDVEVQSRTVTLVSDTGETTEHLVSWEITRTSNTSCPDTGKDTCPDRLRLLSFPQGFAAWPYQAWVDEGDHMRVLIVPAPVS